MNDENLISSYYENYYRQVHYQGWLGKFVNGYHYALERKVPYMPSPRVLEVGGGLGEHIPFVKNFGEYVILEPREVITSKERIQGVTWVVGRGEEMPFPDNSFDRVVFTCVLLHVGDSAKVLQEARRVTRDGGLISIYLPSDPGILFRFIRHFASHVKQRKVSGSTMRETKYVWSLEHRNHCLGVSKQIQHIFREDRIENYVFPVPLMSWNFSLFKIIHIRLDKN